MGSARNTMKRAVRPMPATPTMLTGESAARDLRLHNGYRVDVVIARSRACLDAMIPRNPMDLASMESMSPRTMEKVSAVPRGVRKQHSDTIQADSFPTSFSHA